jgi:quinol-cytochrome oxidoreductase complex cytochrome b subunit
MRYRPVARLWFVLFVVACVWLGYLGGKPAEGIYVIQAQIATAYYFAFFLIILPLLGLFEKPTALPKSIADSVLKRDKAPVAAVAQAAE